MLLNVRFCPFPSTVTLHRLVLFMPRASPRWKYVPWSPPGLPPASFNCSAMYPAARPSPSENVARPSRSSEARYVSQVRSDSGVMDDCWAAARVAKLRTRQRSRIRRNPKRTVPPNGQHIARSPQNQAEGAETTALRGHSRTVHVYLRCGLFTQNRGRADRQGTRGGSFRRPSWKRKAPAA